MADTRFFQCAGPFSASHLAEIAGADLVGNPEATFSDVASLDSAQETDVSFLDNRAYVSDFEKTKAGICLVHPDLVSKAPEGLSLLVTKTPYMGYAKVARMFYPQEKGDTKISPQCHIDESAQLGKGCTIEPGVFIGKNVEIGDNCFIKANAVIREGVKIGEGSSIGANVTLSHCLLGSYVTIHQGSQIGQDGFGFASGPEGHVRIPQLGRVIIGDHVNIGANCTIDRGAGPDTKIGAGTQIDNLVQIGHNVEIGLGCVIVSQVGISGSTKLGNFVVAAGQVGIAGHLTIGDGARLAAQAGVIRNVEAGKTVGGTPAVPQREWLKQSAILNKLANTKKN